MKNNTNNENKFELREPLRSFITSIKNMLNADACSLYLISDEEMDGLEKIKEFDKRFSDKSCFKDIKGNTTEYEILKFIGCDDSYNDNTGEQKKYWNFDYKKRPCKYIIFSKITDIEDIPGEGITGKTARLKKIIYIHDYAKIYEKLMKNNWSDTENKIHPLCQKILSIPIINDKDKLIGVLRLDIYNNPSRDKESTKEFNNYFISGNKKESNDFSELDLESTLYLYINNICQQVIDISNLNSHKDSYTKLFNGEKIIESIKNVKKYIENSESEYNSDNHNEYNINYKIYELIEHLFFVFQRRTYIGYEEIMKRVMYFIKDIFDILEISDYYELIKTKLEEFRDHEQLMLYNTEKYRDHFMHQFHVYILGYILINYIGVKNIEQSINERLNNTADFNNTTIGTINVLRMWTFISFFHDITYIFEEYEDKMQNFISKQLKAKIPVHINWGSMISETGTALTYMDCLKELLIFFETPYGKNATNKEDLFKNYIQSLHSNQDHGVLSALLLIQLFKPFISQKLNNGIYHSKASNEKMVEIYLAALAISFHNKCVFSTLKEHNNPNKLSLESFPLEFLLIYCDTAQEWGRKKEIDKISYSAPILNSIELASGDKKEIVCNLEYQSFQHPDDEKLSSYLNDKISKFCSRTASFKIIYKYKTGKEQNPFTFPER